MQDTKQNPTGPWILGGIVGLVGLLGLFLASAAHDVVFYGTGLTLFILAVLLIFAMIGRYVGRNH